MTKDAKNILIKSKFCFQSSKNTSDAIRTIKSQRNKKKLATNAFIVLIESHLNYCICFWGNYSRYLFNSIFFYKSMR